MNNSIPQTPQSQETIEDLRAFAAQHGFRAFQETWPWGGHTVWGLTGHGPTAGWWSSEYDALHDLYDNLGGVPDELFPASAQRDGEVSHE